MIRKRGLLYVSEQQFGEIKRFELTCWQIDMHNGSVRAVFNETKFAVGLVNIVGAAIPKKEPGVCWTIDLEIVDSDFLSSIERPFIPLFVD